MRNLLKDILVYWKFLVIVLTPILLLPIPLVFQSDPSKCGYVMLLTSVFWLTEALPLAVTSLIPVVLLPLLGIMSTEDVTMTYMKGTSMLFIGSLMMALAVEECNLHRRIALNAMVLIGTSPSRLMLAFMLPTAFLSMWISNTATTAMMLPILQGVLDVLNESTKDDFEINAIEDASNEIPGEGLIAKRRRAMLCMAICFSANVGGTGTIIGTPPNLVLIDNLSAFEDHPMTFSNWIGFTLPILIISILSIWFWLQIYYLGLPNFLRKKSNRIEVDEKTQKQISELILTKRNELGTISYRESSVLTLFIILVALWFFRSPGFFEGWGDQLENVYENQEISIDDATPAILMALFLFILPAHPYYLDFFRKSKNDDRHRLESSKSLIDWKTVESRLAWGVILVLGGGFALADASDQSCLSYWIETELAHLENIPDWLLSVIFSLAACLLTQVLTNTASASLLLPVFEQLSIKMQINPIYLMLPPTLICSYAFMLPVSTAPNALAFHASGLKVIDMVKVGSVVTIGCLLITLICTNTYGVLMFNLHEFPDWAQSSEMTNTTQNDRCEALFV